MLKPASASTAERGGEPVNPVTLLPVKIVIKGICPEVEKENRRFSMIALAVGVLVAVAIVMSKG